MGPQPDAASHAAPELLMADVSRFLHLERPRRDDPDAVKVPPADRSDRFRALSGEAGASEEAGSGAEVARFLEAESPPAPIDRYPYVRCLVCGADGSGFLVECVGCGERLDTPEQKAFHARFWVEERERIERGVSESAELRRQEVADQMNAANERLRLYEALRSEARPTTPSFVERVLRTVQSWSRKP